MTLKGDANPWEGSGCRGEHRARVLRGENCPPRSPAAQEQGRFLLPEQAQDTNTPKSLLLGGFMHSVCGVKHSESVKFLLRGYGDITGPGPSQGGLRRGTSLQTTPSPAPAPPPAQ